MRLLGSLLFRLTLLYALVFSVSIALLLVGYYAVSVRQPIGSVKADIQAENAPLVQLSISSGPTGLRAALEARSHLEANRTHYYALLAQDDRVLFSNLPRWLSFEGERWVSIEADTYHNGEEYDHTALVLDQRLPDGSRLMVGRDIEELRQRQATLLEAARWLIFGGVLFGLVGGIVMSRAIGKRVDSINVTARRVMDGDLSERIPTYKSGDDLDRLAETLNLMLNRIQGLLTSLRRVSDAVAHELRTPLTRLHADLSELSASVPPQARRLVDDAVIEAENVISLFDAVLRIGRIESIRDNVEMGELDLSQLLADASETFVPSAEERGITLNLSVPAGLRIIGNRNLLFQAIGNILDNAIKFSPAHGRVDVMGERTATGVQVRIVDDGRGVPEEQRQNVFERFVRLPETSEIHGLGLGLSFVKAVADAHRSRIALEDARPGLLVRWSFPVDAAS